MKSILECSSIPLGPIIAFLPEVISENIVLVIVVSRNTVLLLNSTYEQKRMTNSNNSKPLHNAYYVPGTVLSTLLE